MSFSSILIANRGEIAIRIARAAADLGIHTVSIFSPDDASSLHVRTTDKAYALPGRGPAAYLDRAAILRAAKETGCDAIHPGYGFLSEDAAFAQECADHNVIFIGPTPETLLELGDKSRARNLARTLGVPLVPGSLGPVSLDEARSFVAEIGPGGSAMIKAVAGGGGRGMRAVHSPNEVEDAYARCRSEAQSAFGNGDVYIERLLRRARHVEVQIIGDGRNVMHAFERDCTLQRRNQKIVEIAPAPKLDAGLRSAILDAATRMARHFPYRGLGTFEFLIDGDAPSGAPAFFFMEANPRLQVEHTVTEEITGLDLVKIQIAIAQGQSLAQLGLGEPLPAPAGYAIQLRVNMETMTDRGEARPQGGTLARFEPPTGPGIRVDSYGYGGYRTNPSFDSLLAKLIVRSTGPDFGSAIARTRRTAREFRIGGVKTNLDFLDALLSLPEIGAYDVDTTFVQERIADILAAVRPGDSDAPSQDDDQAAPPAAALAEGLAGTVPIKASLQGTVCAINVAPGDVVRRGQAVAVLEAMKMEHVIVADGSGTVQDVTVAVGDTVFEDAAILYLVPGETDLAEATGVEITHDLDDIRPDLAGVIARHRIGLDEARPEATARRRARGQRTARENIADLCDPDSFTEYGALNIAAQRQRRGVDELIKDSPADGLVAGIGMVNGASFDTERARCMVMAYDFTVFAGTQGWMNHKKTDRLLELAERLELPLVLFGEGGGGRPGETDGLSIHGLDTPTFVGFARLSGKVPLVAIVAGRCFAGNAALVGCCDVIIATRDSNLGMSGPAMIEGGGLGVFRPEEIGPAHVQSANGVVDIVVADEAEAVVAAKAYLSYFQGNLPRWSCADQRELRWAIPENRRRIYDIRNLIGTLIDEGSMLELGRGNAAGMVTALVRIEGRPMGLIANDPTHLGGAIDAPAARKAVRMMKLCNAFGLPILTLCDTPGFMVGPEAEKAGQVRDAAAMFLAAAKLRVPVFTVVLRKGYGLGAQSMAAGGFHAPVFNVAWPTGEFGGMGIEGAVRLAYRREMEAIADPVERQRFFEAKTDHLYDVGTALNMASSMEIDAVIDPAETRTWIVRGLRVAPSKSFENPRPGRDGFPIAASS